MSFESAIAASRLGRHYDELAQEIGAFRFDLRDSIDPSIDRELQGRAPADELLALSEVVEGWCVYTRCEWAAIFDRWLLAICFGRELPRDAIREFVAHIGAPANDRGLSRLEIAESIAENLSDELKRPGISEKRLEDLTLRHRRISKYAISIARRKELAECLLADDSADALRNVYNRLVTEIGVEVDFPPLIQRQDTAPPSTAEVCIQAGLSWLIHDLAIWLLEIHNEAGPWIKAISYHLDTIDRMRRMLASFSRRAENLLQNDAGNRARLNRLFVDFYIRDEIDYLRRALRKPLESAMAECDDEPITGEMEKAARLVITSYEAIIKDKHAAAIKLLNEFNDLHNTIRQLERAPETQHAEPTKSSSAQFNPRLQWVYLVCNHTVSANNPPWLDARRVEFEKQFEQQFGLTFQAATQLSLKDCQEIQERYAKRIEDFFESRVEAFPEGSKSEELSDGSRFHQNVALDFAYSLKVGYHHLNTVFQSLHEELLLRIALKGPLEWKWGRLVLHENDRLVVERAQDTPESSIQQHG